MVIMEAAVMFEADWHKHDAKGEKLIDECWVVSVSLKEVRSQTK